MAGNAVIVYEPKGLAALERMVRRGFWRKLGTHLARLPYAEEAVAAFYCATDARTPFDVKATLVAALGGMVVPGRLIPHTLRALGVTRDAALAVAAIQTLSAHITPEHRARARLLVRRLRRERAAG